MTTFKVGQRVRIKKDIKCRFTYMRRYEGQETQIADILATGFLLDVDRGDWLWSQSMLEPVRAKAAARVKKEKVMKNKEYCFLILKSRDIEHFEEFTGHFRNVLKKGYKIISAVSDGLGGVQYILEK